MSDRTATTVAYIFDKTRDSSMSACPFLGYCKEHDRIVMADGGTAFQTAPILGDHSNITVDTGAGANATDMTYTDVHIDATWNWAGFRKPIEISAREKFINGEGITRRLSILEGRSLQVMNSMTKTFEGYLVAGPTHSKGIVLASAGAPSLFGANSTATGIFEDSGPTDSANSINTVGGISRATYSNWRHQFVNAGGSLSMAHLDRLFADCQANSSDGSVPDLVLLSAVAYAAIRDEVRAQEFLVAKDKLDLGKMDIFYNGAIWRVSPDIGGVVGPVSSGPLDIYAINTKEIFPVFVKGAMFQPLESDLSLQSGFAVWAKTIYALGTLAAIGCAGSGVVNDAA